MSIAKLFIEVRSFKLKTELINLNLKYSAVMGHAGSLYEIVILFMNCQVKVLGLLKPQGLGIGAKFINK